MVVGRCTHGWAIGDKPRQCAVKLFLVTSVTDCLLSELAHTARVNTILLLIMGIAWIVREHKQALDAQCICNLQCIDGAKQQWALEHYPRLDEGKAKNHKTVTHYYVRRHGAQLFPEFIV